MSIETSASDAILTAHKLRRVRRADCGNGLYATAFFPAGHTIISSAPSATVVHSTEQRVRCHSCFKTGRDTEDSLRRCSRCKSVWYCGAECQRRHWKDTHQAECAHFARLASMHPTDSIILMARFCRSVMKQSESSVIGEAVMSLDGHIGHWAADRQMQFAQMAVLVRDLLGFDPSETSALPIDRIVLWFGLLLCNSFNVCDDEMRSIGIGFYPILAWVNHSCQPNCVAVFDGPRMSIRAITDISPEAQITISYIEIAQSTATRQAYLKEHFFFVCACERCKSPLDAYLSAYACPSWTESQSKCIGMLSEGGTNRLQKYISTLESFRDNVDALTNEAELSSKESDAVSCHVCKRHADIHARQESLLSVRSVYKLLMEKRSRGDRANLGPKLAETLKRAAAILHCANAELVSMANEVQTAAIDNQDYEAAFEASQVLLVAHKKIYPENWPILGLQYFMVGKIAWYLEKTGKALSNLQKAHSILSVSHGSTHPLVYDLSQRIQEAKAESSYKRIS